MATVKAVYIDELFLINLVVNYLLLLLTVKICGASVKRRRLIAAAAFGALYAALTVLPGLEFTSHPALMLASGAAMLLMAFGPRRRFARFAPYIVEAELGRTQVTDACFDSLSKFTHLRALHLEDTAVTGRALGKLSSLSQLTYLNLSGTKVTSDTLVFLKKKPNLHLYLFGAPAESTSPVETSLGSRP